MSNHRFTGVFAAILMAAPALADDPDPYAILVSADKALKAAGSLSFDAAAEGVGALAARTPRIDAAVGLARDNGRLGWKFLVDGRIRPANTDADAPFAAAFDGETVRTLRPAESKLVEAGESDAADLLRGGGVHVVGWALRWDELIGRPFAGDEPYGIARYDGMVAVNTEPCDLIHVDTTENPDPNLYGLWIYIARADSLPRRVEFHYYDDETGDGFTRLTLSNVRTGAAPGSFAIATPDGFEIAKFEPAAAERPRAAARPQPVAVGAPAPGFILTDSAGAKHTLADYKGRVVVLDFWATWCPPCREAMPGVQRLHEKMAARPVAVFGVNAWENGDPAAYMKEHKYTYGLLLNGDETAAAYGVTGIPAFFVIGVDGTLLHAASGYDATGAAERQMEKIIDEHLTKNGK